MEKLTQEEFNKVIRLLNHQINQKESDDLERFGFSDTAFMASNFVRNWFVHNESELSTSDSEKPTEDLIEKERAEARCEALCEVAKRIVTRFETAPEYRLAYEMDNLATWLTQEIDKIRERGIGIK